MFLVTKCLARLTGLASNYGVGFSPVGDCLMRASRLSLTGICCNQQEAWALLGRDSGTCSWSSLSCNSVPGISSLGPVNHGRGDVATGRQTVCNDLIRFLLMSGAHVDRKTHFPIKFLSGTHHRSSLVRTQLLSNVRFLFFPSGLHMIHKEWILGNFNLKFAIRLIVENRDCILLHSHLGSNTSVLVTEAPS